MRLCDNNEVRKEITKKNIDVLNPNASEEQKTKLLNDVMNDTKKLELHKRALAILKKQKEKNDIVNKLSKEYQEITGREIDKNKLNRMAYVMMDTSGTPEAEKKNMEYLISLGDINFARKEVGRIINEIRSFDASKVNFLSYEEGLTFAEENFDIYYYMFCSVDIFNNKKFELDPETNNYLNNIKVQIQQGGNIVNVLNYMASNVYITTPNTDMEHLYSNAKAISKNFAPYAETIDNVELSADKTMDKSANATINNGFSADFMMKKITNLPRLFENGTIPKNLFNCTCKINNESKKLSEGIDIINDNPTGAVFEKLPEEKIALLDNAIGNPALVDNKPEKVKENLLKEFYQKKVVYDAKKAKELEEAREIESIKNEINEMMRVNDLKDDFSEEILNIVHLAKSAQNSRESQQDFDLAYTKNFNSAFKKIYKDILLKQSNMEFIKVDGNLVPLIASSNDIHTSVLNAIEGLDHLMQNVTKNALSSNPSNNKLKFDEKKHVLAGIKSNLLAEGTKSFLMDETAIHGYQKYFVNADSMGLTGTAKYIADGSKIFSTVSKLKESIIDYDKEEFATPDQKELSNNCNLAIGMMEKDAAAIYTLMRAEHNSHNFLWRWFKGSESRAQLNSFKESYCNAFNVNMKTATNHILKIANGLSTVGANHISVTNQIIEKNDFLKYQEKAIDKLNELPNKVNIDEFQIDPEEKIPFADVHIGSIKKVNELDDDPIVDELEL